MKVHRFTVVVTGLLLVVGCRARESSDRAATPVPTPALIELSKDLLFVYADVSGRFHTAPNIDAIPVPSRKVVRVLDPGKRAAERTDYQIVHVVDLTRVEDGKVTTEVMDRFAFEQRALAQLPEGEGSAVALPTAREGGTLGAHQDVIVYSTSWCGVCSRLRAYLKDRGVSFKEFDIESDAAAAAEVSQKAARAGITAKSVPVIDIRGRLVVGFDERRLDTLLGEAM
jgi:glutaredoxin